MTIRRIITNSDLSDHFVLDAVGRKIKLNDTRITDELILPNSITQTVLNTTPSGTDPTFEISSNPSGGKSLTLGLPTFSASALKYLRDYVISRGSGMVTNGYGGMLSNYNFSKFKFERDDLYMGRGCFTSNYLNADAAIDEVIPVNPDSYYEFTFAARTKVRNGESRAYAFVQCLDLDGNSIQPQHLPYHTFKLDLPLRNGDNSVTVHPDDWNTLRAAGMAYRGSGATSFILLANYRSIGGYVFEEGVYTRSQLNTIGTRSNMLVWNDSERTITGFNFNAVPNGEIPAGTKVSISIAGSVYLYIVKEMVNAILPDAWTPYKVRFKAGDVLRKYTAQIRIGWLLNRNSAAGNKVAISAVNFREVEPPSS